MYILLWIENPDLEFTLMLLDTDTYSPGPTLPLSCPQLFNSNGISTERQRNESNVFVSVHPNSPQFYYLFRFN